MKYLKSIKIKIRLMRIVILKMTIRAMKVSLVSGLKASGVNPIRSGTTENLVTRHRTKKLIYK